jgi:ATP-binding cassette subfamily B (MDR/TAP) protein 1
MSIFEILDRKSEKITTGKKLDKVDGSIEFKDVVFSYPQRPDFKIFDCLSFKIAAGKTVAFVGSSGHGKSTVIQLLQRFYDPNSGCVELDGHNIQNLDLKWFREQMALVSQEPILFTMSIKENIMLGRLNATDEEIVEATKQANAHGFIMKLKDKYETLVGERGLNLSGGQKQRIAM